MAQEHISTNIPQRKAACRWSVSQSCRCSFTACCLTNTDATAALNRVEPPTLDWTCKTNPLFSFQVSSSCVPATNYELVSRHFFYFLVGNDYKQVWKVTASIRCTDMDLICWTDVTGFSHRLALLLLCSPQKLLEV